MSNAPTILDASSHDTTIDGIAEEVDALVTTRDAYTPSAAALVERARALGFGVLYVGLEEWRRDFGLRVGVRTVEVLIEDPATGAESSIGFDLLRGRGEVVAARRYFVAPEATRRAFGWRPDGDSNRTSGSPLSW